MFRSMSPVAISAALLFLACSDRPQPAGTASVGTAIDTSAVAGEIRRLSETHAKAAVDRDTTVVGSIYADDVRYLPADGEEMRGKPREIWHEVLRMPEIKISYQPTAISVATSGDLAVERGTIKIATKGKATEQGHYIYVWQPRGGEWKVTDYMWSTRPSKDSR
jgi:ketosteroid isomerase-like protein